MASWLYKWLIVASGCVFFTGSDHYPVKSVDNAFNASVNTAIHPLHLSVTEINHNAADKTLEVSIKIFTDDFERVLRKNFPSRTIDLINPKDRNAMNATVTDYIRSRLSVKTDGRPAVFNCIGFEQDDEATFAYFEVQDITSVRKLELVNTILHDLFTDQTNINHIIVGGKRKSSKLDQPSSVSSFDF